MSVCVCVYIFQIKIELNRSSFNYLQKYLAELY